MAVLLLQQSCYLYLVGHLHLYPTELLSLLPTSLRLHLFAHLPAIDLHRMEQTSLAEGIDTSSYWKELYQNFIIQSSVEQETSVDSKAIFLEALVDFSVDPTTRKVVNFKSVNCFCITRPTVLVPLVSLPLIIQSYMDYDIITPVLVASGLEVLCYTHMYIQPCRFKSLYINDPWTSLLDNVLTTVKVLMNIFEIYADTVSHLYRRSGFSFVNELEKRGSNHDMISHFFKEYRVYIT